MNRSVHLALAFLLFLPLAASAQTVWDESVNGDLSGDRFNPMSTTLTANGVEEGGGPNPVSGYTMVQADSIEDAIALG